MRSDTNNPYVGLRPFEVDESLLFFGRNDQTLELLQRLHKHHFVAVVGGSGCGKSSLLRAGLIPALKGGYLVDDSDHWFIAIMKPGQSPLYNLTESILHQVKPGATGSDVTTLFQKIKEEGADALLNILTPVCKQRNSNFFLLVDQFEELFRFAMDQNDVSKKDEAVDFVNIILELSQQKQIPFYIVITMRSDFIGDCAQFYGLPEAMNQSQYLVPRLNRVQLKTVIEGPAKLYGGKLNPSLTSRLLNELGKVKDELPVLQHALMRIWDFEMNVNKNGELDLKDYESIGGIEKALSNHADEALAGMSSQEALLTKEIFQALTAIDENGRKIRRPVLLSQLEELTGANKEQILKIINLFIKDKRSFLVINKAGDTDDKVIDISHESLIRQWNTLSLWVDREGESAKNYLRLVESAELYKLKQKDFLTGSELQVMLSWYNKFKPVAAWADRYKEGFDESIKYLTESEKVVIKENHEKERKLKLKKMLTRVGVFLFFAAGISTSFFVISGLVNKKRTLEDERMALDSARRADSIHLAKVSEVLNEEIERAGKEMADSIDKLSAEDKIASIENFKKIIKSDSLSLFLKSTYDSLLKKLESDSTIALIDHAIFNLQMYLKQNNIKMNAENSRKEPNRAIQIRADAKPIKVEGKLEPLIKSNKFSIVVIAKPDENATGALIKATNKFYSAPFKNYYGFYLGLDKNKERFDIFDGDSLNSILKSDADLDERNWNLLLATYENNHFKIKVNDNDWNNRTPNKIAFGTIESFEIGGLAITSNRSGFSGTIENILFYDHILTTDEINNLHHVYKHLFK
ncbi:MAG: LamG-like jellyroll fold domain-containing protein [Bacteroidota bacterium]